MILEAQTCQKGAPLRLGEVLKSSLHQDFSHAGLTLYNLVRTWGFPRPIFDADILNS